MELPESLLEDLDNVLQVSQESDFPEKPPPPQPQFEIASQVLLLGDFVLHPGRN